MENAPPVARRRFLTWFLGTTAGALAVAIIYPVVRFVSPPRIPEASTNQLDAGPTNDPELLEKGFKIIRFGAEPVILLKAGDNDFRAFSATCTHLDCIVGFSKQKACIWCNCHNGQYDMATGKNVGGPPPRPLTPFKVNVTVKEAGKPGTIIVSRA